MTDRTEPRREGLRRLIRDDRLDALLVTSEPNVAYLTGFTGDSSALIVGGGRTLIVSDFRFDEQLRRECPGLERHIRPTGSTMPEELGAVLAKLGFARVGFEDAGLSVAQLESIREGVGGVALLPTSGKVEGLRAIKDDGEIAAIRRAVEVAQRAFTRLRAGLRCRDDEKDTADALEFDLRRCGALGSSFPPIVAAGARSALPHARPEAGVRLDEGEFVLFDWGASVGPHGYKSDLTRVVATGKVGPKFERLYRIVLDAQSRGIAAARAGAKAADVDAAARSAIAEAGLGESFGHGLGHGIGLEIHEGPRIRPEAEETLAPGMVVTIEPGIYLPDWGGIRIEDDVLITPDGPEVLSDVPKDLDAVRAG